MSSRSNINYFERETSYTLEKLVLKYQKTNEHNFIAWRIPDTKFLQIGHSNIIANRAKADFDCLFDSRYYAIECKGSCHPEHYNLCNIKEHQVESLLEIEKCGGKGWFLISKRYGNYSQIPMSCYAVHPSQVRNWFNRINPVTKRNITNISWKAISRECIPIYLVPQLKGCKKKKNSWKIDELFTLNDVQPDTHESLSIDIVPKKNSIFKPVF